MTLAGAVAARPSDPALADGRQAGAAQASTSSEPSAWRVGPGAPSQPLAEAPRLSAAAAPLLADVEVLDETGSRRRIHIPTERPLTIFLDKAEVVTLMTLGAAPELLVLGYLRNQRLVDAVGDVESITVDWDVDAAAVRTHRGVPDLAERTAHRVVTTGCGQGTVYGRATDQLDRARLPGPDEARVSQAVLLTLLETMRRQDNIHRKAGSVHGCALFDAAGEPLVLVEDVGRHNAVDTIAGWMWQHGLAGGDKLLYTTGRLTSEMVMKAAQIGVPIIVSRNGVTAMGHALATRLGMALFGRAANRHFLCYCGAERFDAAPQEAGRAAVRVIAG